ncbi:MAG: hypothetical protein R3E18_04450 [Sphingomonadaceae bacterium]
MTDVAISGLDLLTALFTLDGLVWTAGPPDVAARPGQCPRPGSMGFGIMVAVIPFIQLLLGAWAAG